MQKILLATNNVHKIAEIRSILANLPVELVLPREVGLADLKPEENGETYAQNALLKAQAFAKQTDLPVLADDSGIETVAWPGFPGVKSARWLLGSDAARCQGLWKKMQVLPPDARELFYQTVVCYLDKQRRLEKFFTGELRGELASKARGENNFGYDPVFVPAGQEKTLGEMSMAQKNSFSHRGRALQEFAAWYREEYLLK